MAAFDIDGEEPLGFAITALVFHSQYLIRENFLFWYVVEQSKV
jgi:hypothetical protein